MLGYSSTHDTFSHIDYHLISTSLYERHVTSWINPIVISDQAPIVLQLHMRAPTIKSRKWRFPAYLADSEEFRSYLRLNWNNYLDDIALHSNNVTLLWSASKAIMRGHIINYVTHQGKAAWKRFNDLHTALLDAQKSYATSQTPQTQQAYRDAKLLLDALVSSSEHTTDTEYL